MRYLSAEELIALNTSVLLSSHQATTIRNAAGLASIAQLPKQAFFQTEAYPNLESKLGIVFIKIINLHPFADGNKRSAIAALWTMADLNGHWLTFTDTELAQFALEVAQLEDRKLDYNTVYQTIKSHLTLNAKSKD
ncbi:type II toxin-antitoxin system death-on-curing family toxin [Levilactobacillus fujinensis]|uniref:Type II toxin-antitoxin system death-on-curing family toxin n=1 Tax=Levilactobacillus fujinensis TaxID=2486024 RepID=A0ABW1TD06_9LACO|nr:type II toxin-antitoxin system death-on-curing family toxin [Levilactobacillus fujinensis]